MKKKFIFGLGALLGLSIAGAIAIKIMMDKDYRPAVRLHDDDDSQDRGVGPIESNAINDGYAENDDDHRDDTADQTEDDEAGTDIHID